MQRKPSDIERALNPDQDDTGMGRSDTLSLHNTLGTRDSDTEEENRGNRGKKTGYDISTRDHTT